MGQHCSQPLLQQPAQETIQYTYSDYYECNFKDNFVEICLWENYMVFKTNKYGIICETKYTSNMIKLLVENQIKIKNRLPSELYKDITKILEYANSTPMPNGHIVTIAKFTSAIIAEISQQTHTD